MRGLLCLVLQLGKSLGLFFLRLNDSLNIILIASVFHGRSATFEFLFGALVFVLLIAELFLQVAHLSLQFVNLLRVSFLRRFREKC
ncbi:hypothetical protein IWX91DRAFT_334703, partial [Phyllosticta citricarpa]